MKAAIFDVDGTLCDVTDVLHHILLEHPQNSGKKRFDLFHAESVDCPPHDEVIEEYHRAVKNDLAILVVTGRMDTGEARHHTLSWLYRHGIRYDHLVMRGEGDYRPAPVVKKEILKDILALGYEPVLAVDDSPSVVELWESEGIPTIVAPGWKDHL